MTKSLRSGATTAQPSGPQRALARRLRSSWAETPASPFPSNAPMISGVCGALSFRLCRARWETSDMKCGHKFLHAGPKMVRPDRSPPSSFIHVGGAAAGPTWRLHCPSKGGRQGRRRMPARNRWRRRTFALPGKEVVPAQEKEICRAEKLLSDLRVA